MKYYPLSDTLNISASIDCMEINCIKMDIIIEAELKKS